MDTSAKARDALLEGYVPLVLTILIEVKMRLEGYTTSCPCARDPYDCRENMTHAVLTATRKAVEEILQVHASREDVRIVTGIQE